MDFQDILNSWEKGEVKKREKKKSSVKIDRGDMKSFINLYPPTEDLNKEFYEKPTKRQKRRNYRRMKPQEILDLHGYSVVSAMVELDDFIKRCKKRKLEKVLIIHGKGLHSQDGDAVLRTAVKNELSVSPDIGEIGHPSEKEGGVGATWAIIRY